MGELFMTNLIRDDYNTFEACLWFLRNVSESFTSSYLKQVQKDELTINQRKKVIATLIEVLYCDNRKL